ncbi:hypothetical protein BDW22DRAFT_1351629 [Trametopsis cervina]|nr:hypothetical protein BDW22DRAFT_1351629 [Trametopsis cervina]
MPPNSALPLFYWLVFGCYEPLLTLGGAVGALLYPKETYEQQAPWPQGLRPHAPLARATLVTLYQLAHTVGLLGALNLCILWTVRKHLWSQPAIQEKVVRALLTPLLLGDFLHIGLTLWALGDERWDVGQWEALLWITILSGFTLMIPRIAWHLGIGRYVEARDGRIAKKG